MAQVSADLVLSYSASMLCLFMDFWGIGFAFHDLQIPYNFVIICLYIMDLI